MLGLLLVGYGLGTTGLFAPGFLRAQGKDDDEASNEKLAARASIDELPKETLEKVKAAFEALRVARDALEGQNRYTSIIQDDFNAFAVTVGGVDAMKDLQSGRGVDPETFAALYAGRAKPEIAVDIDKDEEGRLTYKNKVVRMYSISRLKRMFEQRTSIVERKK